MASARPDDRLQGAQGRLDGQHPGRARAWARRPRPSSSRARDPGRALRAHRRGQAREAAPEARRAPRPGPREPGAVDDPARPAGRARPRGGPARRLRPRDGHPAVPRVRVPDAHRAAAGAERRARGGDAPRRSGRADGRLRPGRPGRRPRRRSRPAGGSRGRTVGAAVGEAAGLQLSLDFGARRRRRRPAPACPSDAAPATRSRDAARGRAVEPSDLPTRWRPPSPTRRGSRSYAGERVAALESWLAAQPAVGVGAAPRRPAAAARDRAGARASPGRTAGRSPPRARGRGRTAPPRRAARRPLVAHEVKPLLVARFAEDPGARPTPVAFDTQIAAYILNASLRSQTIADVVAEQLDLILPPATELPAIARAGLEALSAIAAGEPLERRLEREGLDRLFREIELPLITVLARMEAVGVALDREALAALERRVPGRDRAARARRSTPTSATSSISAARSSSSRSCSASSTCRRASGRRRATRPTPRCSRSSGRPTRWSTSCSSGGPTRSCARPTSRRCRSSSPSDGRLHTTFHQAVAATGRLSSSDPNLQNIPIRTPLGRRIRRAFVAGGPDVTLRRRRLLADRAADPGPRVRRRAPPGCLRAQAPTSIARPRRACSTRRPADVTADERSMAKMVNFGIAYGMSDFGLSSRANIPRKEAQDFINTYFATYSGISYYMLAHQGAGPAAGLRHDAPRPQAADPGARRRATRRLRAAGERMAINMPIQGTAADIIKIAMIRLAERLRDGGLPRPAAPPGPRRAAARGAARRGRPARAGPALDDGRRRCRSTCRSTVDVKVGDDWEAMTPLTRADAVAGRGRRATRGHADVAGCRSCPRSRPSRAICGPGSSARRSSGRAARWARTLRTQDPARVRGRRRRADGRGGRRGAPSCSWSSCRATPP